MKPRPSGVRLVQHLDESAAGIDALNEVASSIIDLIARSHSATMSISPHAEAIVSAQLGNSRFPGLLNVADNTRHQRWSERCGPFGLESWQC